MPASPFVWYELTTSDPAAAARFYGEVLGWTAADAGMGVPYTLFSVAGRPVAGLMGAPAEPHAPPCWTGTVSTPDVDAAVAKVLELGGKLLRPVQAVSGVGRFALVADPQGAALEVQEPAGEPLPPVPAGTPGAVGWHELATTDWRAAFAFYSKMFGWTKMAVDMEMRAMYQVFAIDGMPWGGMMDRNGKLPGGPGWHYYFNVEDIGSAVGRLEAAGGRVVNGPAEVPGGSWFVEAVDPQGALFALLAPRR